MAPLFKVLFHCTALLQLTVNICIKIAYELGNKNESSDEQRTLTTRRGKPERDRRDGGEPHQKAGGQC